jgi:hypothetical protein
MEWADVSHGGHFLVSSTRCTKRLTYLCTIAPYVLPCLYKVFMPFSFVELDAVSICLLPCCTLVLDVVRIVV